jgi:hypothetical protein
MEKVFAPWDSIQIESLRAFQAVGVLHPYTCGNGGHSHGVLKATRDGWVCEHCDYKQDWALEIMTDWTWITIHMDHQNIKELIKNLSGLIE